MKWLIDSSMEVLLVWSFRNTLNSKWNQHTSNPSTSVVNRASSDHVKTRE